MVTINRSKPYTLPSSDPTWNLPHLSRISTEEEILGSSRTFNILYQICMSHPIYEAAIELIDNELTCPERNEHTPTPGKILD